jgi:hypothetical protein
MELDVTKRYDEILGADGHLPRATFKERILDAAQHQISRAKTQHWASHLRFLSSENSDQMACILQVGFGTSITELMFRSWETIF